MNVDSSSSEETARRAFLAEVEALLPAIGIAWSSIEYRPIRPFGSVGLVLTAPGMPGEACVIAISLVSRQAIDYASFPGPGERHYQLLIKSASGYFAEQCISQDPQAVVAALTVWARLGQGLQRHALPALSEDDLAPLRHLTAIRSSIAQLAQQAAARDLAPGSEEMGREVGLVRANDFSRLVQDLTPASQTTLADDLRHLAPDLLMMHFPREADGRLPLGCTVLLASYASSLPQSRDRQMWLAACAPQRRRDPQVITLTLASLIGVNHAARWDQARWLWDSRHQSVPTEERWGVSDLVLERLGMENRTEHLACFAQRCAQPDASLADRVSLCLLLQDEGRIEEAFSLFGVELSAEVLKILYAQPLSLHIAGKTASWSSTLLSVLASAAPWRFSALPAGERHRICALPHQPQQSKTCLILVTPKKRQQAGAPCFVIENTASNKLLPHVAWRRSIELDLMRFQLP